MVIINVQNGRINHRLREVITGRLLNEVLVGNNDLMFREKEHILFFTCIFFDVIRPKNAVQNESEVSANALVLVVEFPFLVVFLLPIRFRKCERKFIDSRKSLQGMSQ